MTQSFYKGMSYMLLSATAMSLVALFAKFGISDFPVAAIMFWRYFATFSLLFFTLLFLNQLKGALHFRHLKIQFVRAFFVLLGQYCFFFYLKESNLLNASSLLNTGPVFIPVIEALILRKKVGISSWIGAIVSFAGAICILQPDVGIFALPSLIGLLSGISQGASQVVFGIQAEKEERPHIGVLHLFSICFLFSFFPFVFSHEEIIGGKSFGWDFFLIFMIASATIINQLFRAEAYSHGTPSRLSSFLYLSVLLAGFYDWIIFKNPPNTLSIFGAALIILGGLLKIYLRNWLLKKKRSTLHK